MPLIAIQTGSSPVTEPTLKTSPPDGPIDSHAHVFLASLPMVEGARYRPAADAPLSSYLAMLEANGMAGGVLVQVSFLGADNSFLVAALAQQPALLRGIAVVELDASPVQLAALAAAGVRGVRWNLLGRMLPDLADEAVKAHLAALCEAGLHLEVHAEGSAWTALLPGLLASGVTVVIDHFGRPANGDHRFDVNFAVVLAAATHPSVWIKLSAPYRFSGDARMAAQALIERAGTSRLLWGSDWPFTQHPEITDYGALKSAVSRWAGSPAAARAILEDNPRRLYWR